MLTKIHKYLTLIDFVSEKPQILLNKSERAKTIYGGILSLISVMLISWAFLTFALDLLLKKTATMTYNQTPIKKIAFNYGQFPWMVALLDNGIKLIEEEERYYYFLADIWTFTPDNSTGNVVMNLKRTTVNTERCDINKHFGEYKEYFKDVPYLNHHYCPVPGQNVTLFGLYGSSEPYNFLDFWISTCVNDTAANRTDCFSREKSQSRLVNTYISYQYLDYFIDHSNIETPGQLMLSSNILPVSSTIYKRDWFYIRNINYVSDLGIIFTDTTEQNYHQVSSFKETADLRPQGTVPGSFALISVMMDNKIDEFNRRFSKFQEVLANIGGLFKAICLIAYLINYIFFNELYYLSLISGIFKADPNSFSELGKQKSKEEIFSSNKIVSCYNTSSFKLINQIPLKAIKKIPQKLIKKPNDIKLNLLDLICVKCPSKNKQFNGKFRTYNLAKDYTLAHLCIQNILSRLSEINKLKCFIFNKEQISLFNKIPTPSYYNIEDYTKDIWEDLLFADSKKPNLEEVIIPDLKLKRKKSELDKNFMSIIELFE